MKTRITLLALLISSFMNAQSLAWSKQIMLSAGNNVTGFHITTDPSGNVYTTGWFKGTIDFDPSPGVFNLSSTDPSVFVSKLDANGNLLWAVSAIATGTLSNGSNGAYDLETDANGNVYVAGLFFGTLDFDPGSGVSALSTNSSNPPTDSFLWKLDPNGNFSWVKQIQDGLFIRDLAFDNAGNLLAAGIFTGTKDFDWGSGISNLTSIGISDGFISKMDASGNLLDAKQIGAIGASCDFKSISADASSNIYAVGNFSGTIDMDPGSGTYTLNASNSQKFSLKLNASGNFASAYVIDAPTGQSHINTVAHDPSGNIYVVGQYTGTCDFDPSNATYTLQAAPSGVFVYKLNSSGTFLWAKGIDLANNTFSLRFDNVGAVIFSGSFSGSIDADPGPGIFTLNASTGNSFICSLNSSGNFVSAVNSQVAGNLALDAAGSIFVYGPAGAGLYTNKYTSLYTGIHKNQKSNLNLNLFPNPGNGNFILDKTFESDCAVEIYNGSGQKVYMETMSANSLSINLAGCAAGVYLVRVSDKENTVWQKKLVKQ